MARVLIVGCGCRGRELTRALLDAGHAVRGTTRCADRLEAIEGAGAEPVLADPSRLATVTPELEGVGVLCWLLASATGDPESVAALHGPRLESMLAAIVDTPVRGFVYESAGAADPAATARGGDIVRRAGERYRLPVEVIAEDPGDPRRWVAAASAAVEAVLSR